MPTLLPRVVAVLPRFGPSAWITVIKPLVRLHDRGLIRARVTLESLASPADVDRADLIVFCRNVRRDRAQVLHAALERGVPTLYDLDDNFFELPPDSDAGKACAQPEHLAMLHDYLAAASLVRVYSRPLLARAARLNDSVEMVNACVDLSLVGDVGGSLPTLRTWPPSTPPFPTLSQGSGRSENSSPLPYPGEGPGVKTGAIKLIYATSRFNDAMGQIFVPALQRILEEVGPRVEAHFWGPKPPDSLRGVVHHAMIHDYDRFLRRFSAAGFQIGLAPLHDDLFHRSKTNTKFREYGACGIAGVYSNVDIYSDCVQHGETGLLVPNETEAWYQAMRRLVDDAALRTKIQRQARASVEQHYSQEAFEAVFLAQIERLVGSSPLRRASKIDASPAGVPPSKMRRMLQLVPRAVTHLRRHGILRGLNTARWMVSSTASLAWLRWRLR